MLMLTAAMTMQTENVTHVMHLSWEVLLCHEKVGIRKQQLSQALKPYAWHSPMALKRLLPPEYALRNIRQKRIYYSVQ
jgi:hypothetical protein